jgi:hypothetical protein
MGIVDGRRVDANGPVTARTRSVITRSQDGRQGSQDNWGEINLGKCRS